MIIRDELRRPPRIPALIRKIDCDLRPRLHKEPSRRSVPLSGSVSTHSRSSARPDVPVARASADAGLGGDPVHGRVQDRLSHAVSGLRALAGPDVNDPQLSFPNGTAAALSAANRLPAEPGHAAYLILVR
jgi:hypothetical protein